MKIQSIKVSELVEDFDLYPRVSIDSGHVGHIVDALSSGATMPRIIAEEKTLRIIDGFHRARAYKRLYGDDHEMDVEVRRYGEKNAMFIDAMALNSSHGRNMTAYDRSHAIARAISLKIDPKAIAVALNITVDRIGEIKVGSFATVARTRVSTPLKLPARHMAGRTISQAQADVMPKLGGNHQTFYVNQLSALIESDLLDTSNDKLMARLETLHELLEELFS